MLAVKNTLQTILEKKQNCQLNCTPEMNFCRLDASSLLWLCQSSVALLFRAARADLISDNSNSSSLRSGTRSESTSSMLAFPSILNLFNDSVEPSCTNFSLVSGLKPFSVVTISLTIDNCFAYNNIQCITYSMFYKK